MPTTPTVTLSPNISKEGNLLPQQFRHSVTSFRRKEDDIKCAKIGEMLFTFKRRMDEENGKNPNCSKTAQSNFASMLNRPANSISNSLRSLNPDQLRLNYGNEQIQGSRRSLDHNIISERQVLQCMTPNTDSGNESGNVTLTTSCRNKILPLISDVV
ncbi:hypothetical protein LOAG_07480 [Loa loa]|uniref:Uncharacterized protein n=1 Tax=Loa loa TaxID=7209 RepID=A0A1S0TWG5_LOALO|nr:hypothetical protein LOAG_07480 [Loa loa]EFO21009.1 hypothetical protein LOAG_07480 [Loa loa]